MRRNHLHDSDCFDFVFFFFFPFLINHKHAEIIAMPCLAIDNDYIFITIFFPFMILALQIAFISWYERSFRSQCRLGKIKENTITDWNNFYFSRSFYVIHYQAQVNSCGVVANNVYKRICFHRFDSFSVFFIFNILETHFHLWSLFGYLTHLFGHSIDSFVSPENASTTNYVIIFSWIR